MLKYTGRIGCSALTDLVPRFWITPLHYNDISLIINGSFIIARAFYAHVLCPCPDKMCMKINANSRYKEKSAQTVVCQSKHRS